MNDDKNPALLPADGAFDPDEPFAMRLADLEGINVCAVPAGLLIDPVAGDLRGDPPMQTSVLEGLLTRDTQTGMATARMQIYIGRKGWSGVVSPDAYLRLLHRALRTHEATGDVIDVALDLDEWAAPSLSFTRRLQATTCGDAVREAVTAQQALETMADTVMARVAAMIGDDAQHDVGGDVAEVIDRRGAADVDAANRADTDGDPVHESAEALGNGWGDARDGRDDEWAKDGDEEDAEEEDGVDREVDMFVDAMDGRPVASLAPNVRVRPVAHGPHGTTIVFDGVIARAPLGAEAVAFVEMPFVRKFWRGALGVDAYLRLLRRAAEDRAADIGDIVGVHLTPDSVAPSLSFTVRLVATDLGAAVREAQAVLRELREGPEAVLAQVAAVIDSHVE
jgi:hypothetical protein